MPDPFRPTPAGRLVSIGTSLPVRVLAWVALVGATGLLVRAEVLRPDLPDGVRLVEDLVYRAAEGRRVRLDVYLPEGPPPRGGRPALLAIHGGGWRGGGKGDYGRSLAPLVRRGLVVVAVDYKLSRPGEPSWPDNLDDVREAARWVRSHAEAYGIDPDRVAALGASAGGHLALLLALSEPEPPVRAVIDFYGPTDLRTLHDARTGADRAVELYLGGTPAQVPDRYGAASPALRVRPGAPPVLILHGERDVLVPPEQSRALAEALRRAGVPAEFRVVPGALHGFGLRVGARDLVPDVLDALERAWGPSDRGR